MKRVVSSVVFLIISLNLSARRIEEVNIEKKMKDVKELVNKAVDFFQRTPIAQACKAFQHDQKWVKGEITIFVFDHNGISYVNQRRQSIWHDYYDEKNPESESFIKDMIEQPAAGGWVSYEWKHALQHAFVRTVEKNNKKFIIGAGFYPEAASFLIEHLVKDAIRFFLKNGDKETFSRINNPVGPFVRGALYLYVYDMDGNVLAHGQDLGMVGQNLIDWQDANGQYRIRNMIKLAQGSEGKGWLDYMDRGTLKRAYIEKVFDPVTKKYLIFGGGYYPEIDDNAVIDLVRKAIAHLKSYPSKDAFNDFSNRNGNFVKGPLSVFVYDLNGVMLADAQNPAFRGQNLLRSRDAEGKFITKRLLDQAKNFGKGWVSIIDRGAYKDIYVEKIRVADGDFIVGAGYWPSSKPRAVHSIVEKAINFAKSHPIEEALHAYTIDDSDFVRGDVHIFVYDENGICWASGIDRSVIWTDLSTRKDKKGQKVIDKISAIATSGGGWYEYTFNNASRMVYVKSIELEAPKKIAQVGQEKDYATKHETQTFIIGSGYYP